MAGSSTLWIHDSTTGELRTLTTNDLTAASGSASAPSIVRGTDGVAPYDLASETTLEQIRDQGAAIAPTPFTAHTVAVAAGLLPAIATPNGFRLQVPEAGGSVYVNALAGVTVSGANRGWEVLPGTSKRFNWTTTVGVYAIATVSTDVLIEVDQ